MEKSSGSSMRSASGRKTGQLPHGRAVAAICYDVSCVTSSRPAAWALNHLMVYGAYAMLGVATAKS